MLRSQRRRNHKERKGREEESLGIAFCPIVVFASSVLLSPGILFSVQDLQAADVSFSTVAFLAAKIAAIFV
jgi:hypothetical protein